jgi:predicted nicotinamide N-methyase
MLLRATRPPPLPKLLAFVRAWTRPTPVPIVPEIVTYQATELTPLWHATEAELGRADPAPFWAFPWPGGQALARYILDRPELVRGRTVLDFGSGSGLVAIAAARAGAARVEACDSDPFGRVVLELNAELNGVAIGWHEGDVLAEAATGFEVVLAGDVFYERALAESALRWMGALAARGALVLAGDPGRLYTPRSGLCERASYRVPTSMEIEPAAQLHAAVYEVLPSASKPG